MSEDVVTLRGIDKVFSTRKGAVNALKGVDLNVPNGSFVSLVGPSGCGKSTLLKIIGGLIPPTRGILRLEGRDIDGPSRHVGIMFQTPVLFQWRTVLQNVMLPAEIFKLDQKTYAEKARAALDLVGLRSFEHCYPRELSGGMQQRVALSRLLIFDPTVLLMDEPFGALDEFNRERLNLEILRIWSQSKQTVVFVTHNIGEAVFLSDRVHIMAPNPGCIISTVDIPLSRPRTFASMKEPAYGEKVFEIRELLGVAG